MRIFVTGATGALGRHLVPGLVAAGHEVTATTRTPGKVAQLREAGAEPVVLDGLDREAVIAAVRAAAPEVIVHQMTALAGMRSLRKPDKAFAATNELRTRGTDNLLAAAARAGTRRVIAQGYAGAGPDKPSGGALKTEEDPLDWRPIRSAVQGLAAIRHVDKTVPLEAPEGIVLRYGTFYGPGASDVLLEMLRKRQLPVVGGGTGVWSFIEVTDAAAATIAAVGHGAPGLYNVVDDDPAPVAEWLPYLAKVAGAKPPLRGARLARAAARRRVRRGPDDHLARVLEREGEERARLGAAVCELAGGIPCLGQRMRRARPGTGRCCPPSLRDDRFRGRRGGRRAGRVPRPDPGPPGGDHDHRSEGVPDDRGVAAGHQLPEFGAGATGDVRGGLASRAGRRARRRPGAGRAPSWSTRCPWRSLCCWRPSRRWSGRCSYGGGKAQAIGKPLARR